MKKKLTPKTIQALQPEQRRYELGDTEVSGLVVRVSPANKKTFCLNKRVNGRMKRISLGAFPIISLSDARQHARETLRDIELGNYNEDVTDSPEDVVPTLGNAIEQFIELFSKPRNKCWKNNQSLLAKFSTLNDRRIDQIKRTEIVQVLDNIIASGSPVRANRALAAIKTMLNWCVDRGMIELSPIATLKPPTKEHARERVLSDQELSTISKYADEEGYPFGPFLKTLILTGQRRGEVSGMRWSELDLENATWTIPSNRAKNASMHIVPLAPLLVDLLNSIPKFMGSDFVFTTTGRSPISGFGRLKKRLERILGNDAEDWRPHDIRRTMASNMAKLGIQPHIIEAALNHKSGIVSGVAAVYNRYSYIDEKREAFEKWAKQVEKLLQQINPMQEIQKVS